MLSGEFNSKILQEVEQEDFPILNKPLEPSKLHPLLTQVLETKGNLDNNCRFCIKKTKLNFLKPIEYYIYFYNRRKNHVA